MKKASLTPSVYLVSDIPDDSGSSFVNGQVYTTVNDSAFEASSPWRHASAMAKFVSSSNKKIVLLFTDGGTDHRCNLQSVQASLICLFIDQDLDMIIAARCAPGQSFTNPAERIMSILNLGLQNCSFERLIC